MSHRLTRRHYLALALGAIAAAGSVGASTAATGFVVGAIRVVGTRNRTLAELAPMVAEQIATILGERHSPGARGAATMLVELTEVIIDNGDGGTGSFALPFGHDSGVDQLQGTVTLVGPRREALAEFPMLASASPTFRSQLRMFPDPRRLQTLARAFAWWTVGKIS